ncbi:nucleotidyltransferase domain-containing protein [Ectothiorhodospiraceae bacterium BW-2]|nr:nucleotidyltransferase domain-containing protein [Ectothiorhodospiraceae bacterium BW-2]
MIKPEIESEIHRRLHAAEAEHQVTILYACESGSRAWGFESSDSDYDVRFIYAHRTEWYLTFDVERQRDVIEYPIVDEIDYNGWDIRKALYLFTRTNGALLEWLNSPVVYVEQGNTAQQLRQLAQTAFNPVALCYHYHHMAQGNWREYLQSEQVRLKKYLYVIRPLLAIRYIEQNHTPPPVAFAALVAAVAPEWVRSDIEALIEHKRHAPELGVGEAMPALNRFIKSEIERHGDSFKGLGRPALSGADNILQALNRVFRESLATKPSRID